MRKFFSSFIIVFWVLNSAAQTGWVAQNSGTTFTGFYDVEMLNVNTCVVVGYYPDGYGKVYLTTNQGNTWTNVYQTQNPLHQIEAVSFGSASTGLAVGGPLFGGVPLVLRTTNGGLNWSMLTATTMHYLYGIKMLDANMGFAVGDSGKIHKTTDSGQSWTTQTSGTTKRLNKVSFVDNNTGAAAGAGGVILHTTNSGLSWVFQNSDTSRYINDIYFLNAATGMAVGNAGLILYTSNGGTTWVQQNSNFSGALLALSFINPNTCTVTGANGTILRTTNAGLNWLSQNSGITQNLRGVSFIDTAIGTAVGDQGKILRTTNGGVTFIEVISNEIPNKYSLEQNYPNPFNPTSKIRFDLPENSTVKIYVYDITGREINVLANGFFSAGTYTTNFNASDLPSGVYICRMTISETGFSESIKMAIVK